MNTGLSKILLLIVLLISQISASAQKNDTIYLNNGDRITGELKKFEKGFLVLSTDGMSTINIEYEKIKTMYSAKYFEILTSYGGDYFGSILPSETALSIRLALAVDTIRVFISDVVQITQIKNRFWKKFYGSVDLGLSYYKSTDILQTYFNTDINYRSKKNFINFNLSTLSNSLLSSDSSNITKKNDVSLMFNHFYSGNLWAGIGIKAQQNTELDLASRIQILIGTGYDFITTNNIHFYGMGGLLANSERTIDSTKSISNYEGLLGAKFELRQNRHPKISFTTSINVYPSLSISKRWRLEYDISLKYEVIKDFYVNLTFYDYYDSNPGGESSALNDLGGLFSIGYTF